MLHKNGFAAPLQAQQKKQKRFLKSLLLQAPELNFLLQLHFYSTKQSTSPIAKLKFKHVSTFANWRFYSLAGSARTSAKSTSNQPTTSAFFTYVHIENRRVGKVGGGPLLWFGKRNEGFADLAG
jgi:hypothetical protein